MIQLKNDFLIVDIELPNEGYAGSRFDKMGKVTQLKDVKGNTYFTQEQIDRTDTSFLGKGLFGEFGIDKAVGYDECKVGEYFPKIGVGMVKRISNDPYDFFFQYEYVPFDIKVEKLSDVEVSFECESKDVSYPFLYKKVISIVGNSLNVSYLLVNLGDKVIRTNEYIHNFVSFNHNGVNDGLSLCFDSSLSKASFEKGINPCDVVSLSKEEANVAHFTVKPDAEFFFGGFVESPRNCTSWSLYNKQGLCISERADFEVENVNVWGSAHVASPELFLDIVINPKDSKCWNRTYEFGGKPVANAIK